MSPTTDTAGGGNVAKLAFRSSHTGGVICMHCYQPTPLTPAAEHKENRFEEHGQQESDEFSIFSNPLRCRWCHGEAVYTPKDVREFEGNPRKRVRRSTAREKQNAA
jgi:hypothetical protein